MNKTKKKILLCLFIWITVGLNYAFPDYTEYTKFIFLCLSGWLLVLLTKDLIKKYKESDT